MPRRIKNPLVILYILSGYIFIQFCWWMIHLFQVTKAAYPNEIQSKKWMIFGEGLVFLIILIFGVYTVTKAVKKEIAIRKLQNNFLLSVTHELKTPIASIKLLLQTIGNKNLPDERKEKLVHSGLLDIERLNKMIDNLLLTARVENHQHDITIEPINLTAFLKDLVNKYGHIIEQKHVLTSDIKDNLKINSESTSLSSILLNLIENAVKYSPSGSKISLHGFENENEIIVEVRDEGIGIPEVEKEKILQKFYRIGNENTRTTKGSGLGLYIVSELVKLNQAKLLIRNNSPKGSIFSIKFAKS